MYNFPCGNIGKHETVLFENENNDEVDTEDTLQSKKNLSEELDKLNNLLKDGVLTEEEFEKAKKKILDN